MTYFDTYVMISLVFPLYHVEFRAITLQKNITIKNKSVSERRSTFACTYNKCTYDMCLIFFDMSLEV